jgi:ribosomal protein S18 acetylase RimI-like enzyme
MLDFLSMQISSSPQVILRQAQSDDFEFINEVQYLEMKEILSKAWKNRFNWESWNNDLVEAATGALHKVFVIEVDTFSAGYLWLNVELNNLWITAIVLATKWQRQRIGDLILHFLIEECRKENLKSIELGVQHNNDKALNFYKKLGFKQFDHLKQANTDLLRLSLE